MLIMSRPSICSFELTAACTNQCPACGNVFPRSGADLSCRSWHRILESLASHVQTLKITGGEPTLHPEFADIVRFIGEKDIPLTLFTNGRWAKPQGIIDLLKSMPRCVGLLVSLHGADAATHERFTCTPGSFEETCENIGRATAAGLRVHTSTVLTCFNYRQVRDVAALARALGAKRAVFNRYLGPPLPGVEPDEAQLRHTIGEIEALRKAFGNKRSEFSVKYGNCIPQCFEPSSSSGCWAGVSYCTIDPWGNLRPCNHSPLVVGNLLETSIEGLWQSEAMDRWRALRPAECGQCGKLAICHGGCRAMIEIRGLARDPLATGPLPTIDSSPREITLYEGARPRAAFKMRSEPFGYVLARGECLAPVTPDAGPILDALTGQHTLAELQARFGQDALDFIGSLYWQGLIDLD